MEIVRLKKEHIMEATNDHRYERIMDGNEEML